MKKILALVMVLLFTLSLLTACGGDSGGKSDSGNSDAPASESDSENSASPAPAPDDVNDTTGSAAQDTRLIKPSELITLEDAGRILGGDVTVSEKKNDIIEPELAGAVQIQYKSNAASIYYMTICLFQDAAFDATRTQDKVLLDQGGTANYNATIKPYREQKEDAVLIDGIGEWACISGFHSVDSSAVHTLEICYGDYCISITMVGWPKDNSFSDEEKIAWKTEKLTEAGKLAFERLEAII